MTAPAGTGAPTVLGIANADAGTAQDEAVERAVAAMRDAGADVRLERTSADRDLDEVLDGRDGRDVIALGGDGTLHLLVERLWRRGELGDPVLGLVPLGTGNDFARSLDLPVDPTEAARLAVSGRVREMDLIVTDDDSVVVNAVHIGLSAEASARADPWKRRLGKVRLGKLGYVVGAALSGVTRPGGRFTVEVDGERLARAFPVLQIAVGNGGFVGGGTELVPDADPADRLLDVEVSYATSLTRRMLYVVRLRRGTHLGMEDVVRVRGREVRVAGDPSRASADGELVDEATSWHWRLEPAAWRLRH